MNFCSLTNASYIMKTNQSTPIIDMVEPIELTKFQVAKLSGKSEYLLGMPANPKKCCGKKVRLTPMKVIQKCTLPYVSL